MGGHLAQTTRAGSLSLTRKAPIAVIPPNILVGSNDNSRLSNGLCGREVMEPDAEIARHRKILIGRPYMYACIVTKPPNPS